MNLVNIGKMKRYIYYLWLLVGLGLTGQGCYEENELTASGDEPVLSAKDLPQGNHEYDNRIMAWSEDYGVLTFYRFPDKEFWWTPTADIRPKPAAGTEGGTSRGYEGVQADSNYVGHLVKLLDEEFFAYYTKEQLKNRMPKKFLLMGELTLTPTSSLNPEYAPKSRIYTHVGYDRIAINMANEDILKMTEDSIRDFRNDLHSSFLSWQITFGFIEDDPEFFTVTTYGKSYSFTTETAIRNFYGDGLISGKGIIAANDWSAYITAIVTHTYEELTGEIDPNIYVNNKFDYKQWQSAADQSLGMLNRDSKKGWDKSGKINEKYEIVINYFKEKYGLDLQAIGNGKKLRD